MTMDLRDKLMLGFTRRFKLPKSISYGMSRCDAGGNKDVLRITGPGGQWLHYIELGNGRLKAVGHGSTSLSEPKITNTRSLVETAEELYTRQAEEERASAGLSSEEVAQVARMKPEQVRQMVRDQLRGSAVEHPSHYGGKDNPYEAIKVLKSWLTPEEYIGWLKGNVFTYLQRHRRKDGNKDVGKAEFYMKDMVTFLESMGIDTGPAGR